MKKRGIFETLKLSKGVYCAQYLRALFFAPQNIAVPDSRKMPEMDILSPSMDFSSGMKAPFFICLKMLKNIEL